MAIYLWLIAFVLGASPMQRQYKKIYLSLSLFFIWVVIAFRSFFVGSDTLVYTGSFPGLANFPLASYGTNLFSILFSDNRFEYGYVVLNKIIYYFSHNPRWLLIVSATIIVILIGYILYKYCEDPALALIIFITMGFMAGSMSQIRQYIAWAICVFSIKYIMQNKPIKFILIIILAMLFHISSIVFLPMYVLSKIKFTFSKSFWLTLILTPVFIYFVKFSNIAGAFINTYDNYDARIAANGTTGHLAITVNLITISLYLIIADYLYKKQNSLKKDKLINLSFWMIMCGWLAMILSYKFSQFTRLSTYFTFAIMFLFPNELNSGKSAEQKDLLKILLIIFFIVDFIVINTLRPGWHFIVPYRFMSGWWE